MLFSVGVFVLLDHYPLGRTVYVDADVGGWLLIAFGVTTSVFVVQIFSVVLAQFLLGYVIDVVAILIEAIALTTRII